MNKIRFLNKQVLRTAGLADADSAMFGWTRVDGNGNKKIHQGWDLAADVGTPIVLSGHRCVVLNTEVNGAYGLTLTVYVSLLDKIIFFAHLNKVNVKQGQLVEKGQLLASTGNTGNASKNLKKEKGAHLHVEIREKFVKSAGLNNRLDPVDFIILD